MNLMPELNLDYSYWLLILCVSIGALYAFLLYSKKAPWSNKTNKLLALLRFVTISFLAFLLLNPLLKQLVSQVENPVFVIGIDNSSSILNTQDTTEVTRILNKLSGLSSQLEERNFDVEYRTLNESNADLNKIDFTEKTTDLNEFFRNIQSDYESRNFAGTLLVSDGNYNTGVSPAYFPYGFRISTLGIGDTTLKQDIILKNVLYNKLAYEGNKFPVVAEVINAGFENKKVKASIRQGSKVLDRKEIHLTNSNGFNRIEFEIAADKKGINSYSIEIEVDANEAVRVNNRQNIFVDIIDGKQKILVLAPAPHPDIKAIQSVIGNNDNYELDIFIPNVNKLKNKKYDLVIVHQYYDRYRITNKYLDQFIAQKIPLLHVIGQQSNEVLANNNDPNFNFKQIRNQYDMVGPSFNPDFKKFTFDIENNDILNQFPTINIPYGELKLSADADIILYQKVGSIVTNKPLLYVKEINDQKSAYMLGDGFWQWRLQEYALNENSKVFDELFSKIIQYLSTKADKRKFRVKTSKTNYFDNESILFSTEVYNDIYERIYGDQIQLKVSNGDGFQKEYSFASSGSNFEVSGLPHGIYSFTARLPQKSLRATGKFTIKELQLELLDQSANYNILRQISKNTNGKFYKSNEFDRLSQDLKNEKAKGVIHANEEYSSLINLKWLFFLILLLISGEWFVRKYSGGY